MINVFEQHDIVADATADTDLFWDLLKCVIPHDAEREHFVNWYAYPLQNPERKSDMQSYCNQMNFNLVREVCLICIEICWDCTTLVRLS